MSYFEKYLKYKNKYLNLLNSTKLKSNIVEYNEHPLAHLKKYNFLQTGGVLELPKLYDTRVPCDIERFLKSTDPNRKVAIVYAPTGYGKTVSGCRIIAKVIKDLRINNPESTFTGDILMPFRISVKEMYQYLILLNDTFGETLEYGYEIGGEKKSKSSNHAIVHTVGHWLESFLNTKNNTTQKIIMLDEAHDVSWQTDLVLNLLFWQIRKGANIKILISSATLDVDKINIKYGVQSELFDISPLITNQNIHYNTSPINVLKVANDYYKNPLYDILVKQIIDAYGKTKSGHILVLLPGEKEIKEMNKLLKLKYNKQKIKSSLVLNLYTDLPDHDKQLAIKPNKSRKIILATNMVENAITIDDLVATVDSCVRKVLYIHPNNIEELMTVYASQSNIKQTYGRAGRQLKEIMVDGKKVNIYIKGEAYLALSEQQFNLLNVHSPNETELNPIYKQLIKILKSNLPYRELVKSVTPERLQMDINYLLENNIIIKKEIDNEYGNDYELTDIGILVSNLGGCLNSSIFIANCILYEKSHNIFEHSKNIELDKSNYYYHIFLIGAWIDSRSVFLHLDTSNPDYITTKQNQSQLFSSDSLSTFLNIWNTLNGILKITDKVKWYVENSISSVEIKSIIDNIEKSLGIKINKNNNIISSNILNQLYITFNKFKLRLLKEESSQIQYVYIDSRGNKYYFNNTNLKSNSPSNYIYGIKLFYKKKKLYIDEFVNRIPDTEDVLLDETERVKLKTEPIDRTINDHDQIVTDM